MTLTKLIEDKESFVDYIGKILNGNCHFYQSETYPDTVGAVFIYPIEKETIEQKWSIVKNILNEYYGKPEIIIVSDTFTRVIWKVGDAILETIPNDFILRDAIKLYVRKANTCEII